MKIRIRACAVVTVVGLSLAIAACGSDNSSSSSTTVAVSAVTTASATSGASTSAGASNAALCSARDALTTSLQDLASVDVIKNGTSSLQAPIDSIKKNLADVKSAAGAELQPDVKAFEDSLTQLQTAVSNGGAAGIATAATAVAKSGATLLASLQTLRCS
jgi:hypothetical protein